MDKAKLGQTGDGEFGTKDAFHVPCVWVYSYDNVKPGQSVKFEHHDRVVICEPDEKRDGIVDPFISGYFDPADGFWVMLEPSVVTDFTHTFRIKGVSEEDDAVDDFVNNDDAEDDGCRGCNN